MLKVEDFKRLRFILGTFFEEGFDFLIKNLRLKYLIPLKFRLKCLFKKCRHKGLKFVDYEKYQKTLPARLRLTFEKLGPTFIKFGQILSLRPDIIPSAYADELKKLQDDVPPFSYQEAKEIVEQELGKPLHEVFQSFARKPIAAASLAQVHGAKLKDGTEVAIKIQRPNVRDIISRDIHLLFFLAHVLEKNVKEAKNYQPMKIVKEFADWTMRELDFMVEASNMDRFRYNFSDDPTINIPKVYWDYTTSTILTMDLVHGVKADDLKGMQRIGVDPQKLALIGIRAGFKQFFLDGFFHADPHPGNFFALPGNILCLHDFGIVGYFSPEMRLKLVSVFISFISKDVDGFLRKILDLAEITPEVNKEAFSDTTTSILNKFLFTDLPLKKRSIALAFYQVINSGAKYGVIFPSNLVIFGKALLTLESMGLKLYPDFDLNRELEPYIKEIFKAEFAPSKLAKEFKSEIFDYLSFLKNLPRRTRDLVSKIESGKLEVKIDASEILGIKEEFDRQNDVRVLSVLVVALIIGSAIVFRLEERALPWGISLGKMGFFVSAILVIWLSILIKRKAKK